MRRLALLLAASLAGCSEPGDIPQGMANIAQLEGSALTLGLIPLPTTPLPSVAAKEAAQQAAFKQADRDKQDAAELAFRAKYSSLTQDDIEKCRHLAAQDFTAIVTLNAMRRDTYDDDEAIRRTKWFTDREHIKRSLVDSITGTNPMTTFDELLSANLDICIAAQKYSTEAAVCCGWFD